MDKAGNEGFLAKEDVMFPTLPKTAFTLHSTRANMSNVPRRDPERHKIEFQSTATDMDLALRSLADMSPNDLSVLIDSIHRYLYWWVGEPTIDRVNEIRSAIPFLESVIDFSSVCERFPLRGLVTESPDRPVLVSMSDVFPELSDLLKLASEQFGKIPKSLQKAEHWLYSVSLFAGGNADIEAVVYFASRGMADPIDLDSIRKSWHSNVCLDIEHGHPVGKVPPDTLRRAKDRTISLAEAASILEFNHELPRFFSFRDEEKDFIDATFFRGVERLGIRGFDPWLNSILLDLSKGPQGGIDHSAAASWLFFWCRSDLALRMADRQGLESWLWALVNGPFERGAPWQVFYPAQKNPRLRDFVPVAAALPFIWTRIQPSNITSTVLDRALALISQTQMSTGPWPSFSDSNEPSFLATCFAIHSLYLHKPPGWDVAAKKAANWLEETQTPDGPWHISGGPTVFLTVLALDSIALGREHDTVTFRKMPSETPVAFTVPVVSGNPPVGSGVTSTFDVEPKLPQIKTEHYEAVRDAASSDLLVVTATQIELQNVLAETQCFPRRHHVLKIHKDNETYYLGRFGAFRAAVTLTQIGAEGPGAATLAIDAAIRAWKPKAVMLLGIAFGTDPSKQKAGDVLVADKLIPYEQMRIGQDRVFRNPIPPTNSALVNRFRNALDWDFRGVDQTKCRVHVGAILSGQKLVDSPAFKADLVAQHPTAIGGEMEGTGLWSAADRNQTAWVVVKGVCDWADGKKHDGFQGLAAAAAVSLAIHVFSEPTALDGIA